nr:RNA-directed DNA polymerase, eukaryota, reverse transcriptase zinc-binding domain protein [Tanacetum cinerariifolium]
LVDNGLFSGIQLPGSVTISHLFYADDAMFIGEWSEENLKVILNALKCFFLASGGRLTLLKSVLGASPIFSMFIFKVPCGVLKIMEAIRSRFFNGIGQEDSKITWISRNKALASKKRGGLGGSSFFALNRALLLKWVWRFISQDGSLWSRVIRAIYGPKIDAHTTHTSSNWCAIVRELHSLKDKWFIFGLIAKNVLEMALTRVSGEFELSGPPCDMMVGPMKEKLRKYFKEIPPVITCAAALNPCFNISGVEIFIEKISIDLNLYEEDINYGTIEKNNFNKCVKDLFDIYFNKYGSKNVPTSSAHSSSSMSSNTSIFHTLRQESVKRSRSDNTGTNEFGRYAGTDWIISMEQEEFNAFDILSWWKGRQSQFPDHLDAQERIQHISNLEGGSLDIEEQLLEVEAEAGYEINLADEEINPEEQAMSGSGLGVVTSATALGCVAQRYYTVSRRYPTTFGSALAGQRANFSITHSTSTSRFVKKRRSQENKIKKEKNVEDESVAAGRWLTVEEELLATCYVAVSEDNSVGRSQKHETFWYRVLNEFNSKNFKKRTNDMLTSKCHTLNANCQKFNAAYKRAKRLGKSGENDVYLMKRAQSIYRDEHKGVSFSQEDAWAILKFHPNCDAAEQVDLTGDVPGDTQEDLFGHDARPHLMEQELRLKRKAAERAFEAQAGKDRTLMRLEELRFLAISTKDLDNHDAYWIKKQKRLIKNKMRNDLGGEDDEDE